MEDIQTSDSFKVTSSVIGEYNVNFIDDLQLSLSQNLDNKKLIYLIDDSLPDLYPKEIKLLLDNHDIIYIDAKESNKTLDYSNKLIENLLKFEVKKDSTLIAVGGGITQDLVAFISSILFRGINWNFYPTTLLGQCDSCIGSKTSINFKGYKNLLGTFLPPKNIFIYTGFLSTLEIKDIKSGIGEMCHYFLGKKESKIFELFDEYENLIAKKSSLLPFIKESLNIKKKLIELDEYDKKERHIFNYGHTFGHALEFITNNEIPHGQAVTVGINIANFISLKKKLLTKKKFDEIYRLTKINFPEYKMSEFLIPKYIDALSKDKKNKDGYLGCILLDQNHVLKKHYLKMDNDFKKLLIQFFEIN
tara:strand:+ start:1506 stop:2588 length:1083 start_codon:yes stop_codon:yes gene_type:complete